MRLMIVISIWTIIFFSALFGARPLATDDPGTVEPEVLEMELSYDLVNDDDDNYPQQLGVSLKSGISDRVDFGVAFPYQLTPDAGLGAAEICIKYAIRNTDSHLPGLAGTFAFDIPSNQYRLNAMVSERLGAIALHINLGYGRSSDRKDEGTVSYSGAIEVLVAERIVLCTEVLGEENKTLEMLVGAGIEVLDNIVLDAGISRQLDEAGEIKITLGSTIQF